MASTTPATSWPRIVGSGCGQSPSRKRRSLWQMPAAAGRTSTSRPLGAATEIVSTSSGEPTSCMMAARTNSAPRLVCLGHESFDLDRSRRHPERLIEPAPALLDPGPIEEVRPELSADAWSFGRHDPTVDERDPIVHEV